MCVLLPAPSMPENETISGFNGQPQKVVEKTFVQCPGLFGTRLGLAAESPATVPIAMPAPARMPSVITKDRTRRCFGGARTTPAGLEAAPPLGSTCGATAVPFGSGLCCCCPEGAGAGALPAGSGVLLRPGFSGSSTAG